MKRVLSTLFSLCLLFAVIPYSCASEYTGVSTIYSWMAGQGGFVQKIVGYLSGSGCPESVDGKHHASSYVVDQENGHYKCVCSECGHTFVAYEEDLQEAESEYVATLPATGVNSDGGLIWQSTLNDVVGSLRLKVTGSTTLSLSKPDFTNNQYGWKIYPISNTSFSCYIFGSMLNWSTFYGRLESFDINIPLDGMYRMQNIKSVDGISNFDGVQKALTYYYSSQNYSLAAGGTLSVYMTGSFSCPSDKPYYVDYNIFLPAFEVTPVVPFSVTSTNTSDTYNIGTRASSITGNYGIVNSGSGEVTKIDSQTIVNETNNTYYSPATGEQQTFTDWSYDYGDRTYNLTTESGDTVTITYGDEHVTVNEGDTITNIYYITETSSGGNGGDDTPSTPAHTHSYTSEVTTEPTCTRSGVRTYTCDGCGNTYTEYIPATGHAWEVKSDVKTQYDDETGELLQAGYILYYCPICGQEYRADDESLPPAVVGGNLDLQEVSENVQSMFPSLSSMYQGYLGFLGATFPYLPDDIMKLFYFGLSSVVLVGIFKALRG